MRAPHQIPLRLPHQVAYGRDDYVVGAGNRDAFALVVRWPDWPSPLVALSGPAGAGKSHLLHLWAERSGGRILGAAEAAGEGAAEALAKGAAAVDDIDPAAVPETALFHLINAAREAGASLVLAARLPPPRWRLALPDLISRLRLATPACLAGPDTDLLRHVLVKLFADRQIVVDKSVVDYLLLRMEHSFAAASRLVAALDEASLAGRRPITRPLAAQVLEVLGSVPPFAGSE